MTNQSNQAYLIIILLSRVITRLGEMRDMNTGIVESLFSSDLAYLQELYNAVNQLDRGGAKTSCPRCDHSFALAANGAAVNGAGGS